MDTPTSRDLSRLAATERDQARHHYTLSLDQVMKTFDEAQMPRTMRTLQRYCANGRLECLKTETPTGDAYVVDPQSVQRAIGELKLIYADRRTATGRDMTHSVVEATKPPSDSDTARPVATQRDESAPGNQERKGTTQTDVSRSVATDLDIYDHPYVKRLENQVEKLETKYEAQVRRTEEIQLEAQERLVELQRMTTIGQSKTLAEFMLQAKNWIVGAEAENVSPSGEEGKPAL